jgi:hypothetical protein
MNIIDTIQAQYIEDDDQIIVDGDPLEAVELVFAPADDVVITGYSNNTGDRVCYVLTPTQLVQVWAV